MVVHISTKSVQKSCEKEEKEEKSFKLALIHFFKDFWG